MNNLKVSDVSYEYKNLRALDNISFEVNDGLIGVLGANGAGKSTLMKLITTLYKLQGGSIELNGLSYDKNLKDIRNSLGYLPQNFEVYDNLTGEEFLQIVASLKKGIKVNGRTDSKRALAVVSRAASREHDALIGLHLWQTRHCHRP